VSHIVIIVNRAPPPTADETDSVTASVSYHVPHDATDQQVAQAVKQLFKQVKNLGSEGNTG